MFISSKYTWSFFSRFVIYRVQQKQGSAALCVMRYDGCTCSVVMRAGFRHVAPWEAFNSGGPLPWNTEQLTFTMQLISYKVHFSVKWIKCTLNYKKLRSWKFKRYFLLTLNAFKTRLNLWPRYNFSWNIWWALKTWAGCSRDCQKPATQAKDRKKTIWRPVDVDAPGQCPACQFLNPALTRINTGRVQTRQTTSDNHTTDF